MESVLEVRIVGRRLPAVRTVVGRFEEGGRGESGARPEIAAALRALKGRRGWRGREGQSAEVEVGGRLVEFRGLGRRDRFDARKLRAFVEGAVERARAAGEARVAVTLPDHPAARGEAAASRVVREAALATYRFDRFHAERSRQKLRTVLLAPPRDAEPAAWREGLRVGLAVAAGVAFARDLANTPPNVATPDWMAAQARALRAPLAGADHGARSRRAAHDAAWAGCSRSATARPTRRGWCVSSSAADRAPWRWSARASPSTPAASRSSRRRRWTR